MKKIFVIMFWLFLPFVYPIAFFAVMFDVIRAGIESDMEKCFKARGEE